MVISIVISGEYESKFIKVSKEGAYIELDKHNSLLLDSSSVLSYEVIDSVEDIKATTKAKRGIVGSVLAGGIGAVAAMSTTKGEMTYRIKLIFTSGKASVIQCDKSVYDKIVYHCLNNGTTATPSAGYNKFCSSCGSPITGAGKFCSSCGFPIDSSPVAQPHIQSSYTPNFSGETAQNIIVYNGHRFDLDTIFVECKGKPIKFSMRMMKEAKNAGMSKEETNRFTKAVDTYFKPKMEGKTPNIGIITI